MRSAKKILFWAALALAALAVTIVFLPRSRRLVLENASGRILHSFAVADGGHFTIKYTHSVAKTPVEEIFEITGPTEFRLRETVYMDFGAGLPHEEGQGMKMVIAGGKIRMTGYDTKFGEIQLRVGRIADHMMRADDGEYVHLAGLANPGAMVRVAVVGYPYGLWSLWDAGNWLSCRYG